MFFLSHGHTNRPHMDTFWCFRLSVCWQLGPIDKTLGHKIQISNYGSRSKEPNTTTVCGFVQKNSHHQRHKQIRDAFKKTCWPIVTSSQNVWMGQDQKTLSGTPNIVCKGGWSGIVTMKLARWYWIETMSKCWQVFLKVSFRKFLQVPAARLVV